MWRENGERSLKNIMINIRKWAMNRMAMHKGGYNRFTEKSFRFPVFLLILVFQLASCGGGGGGGSSSPSLAVQTDNATSVTQNEAVLNGSLTPNGTAADAWFEIGINPNLASYDNTAIQTLPAGTTSQPIFASRSGLTPGTTYYFRVVASDGSGREEGEILNFTTHNPPPVVTTDDAAAITLTGATLHGIVNPNGAATDVWFEYWTDSNLAAFMATDNQSLLPGRAPVAVEIPISGLNPGVTYFFRAVASSVEGEVEGAIKSFSTDFPPPAATTGSATGISTTGATFNGIVNPNGFSTEAWFEYGTDNSLASYTETTHQLKGSGTDNVSISGVPIAPLTEWTTYYFRAVARSTTDPSVFTKGTIKSFPTGEYYVAVGDSITEGSHDDIPGDGIGFEPILDVLLTNDKGYPHEVIAEGTSGDTSENGASRISGILSAPGNLSAKYFLILYGTNDASIPAVPSGVGLNPGDVGYNGSYKANMQSIITAIKNAGKIPYLAKVPYTTDATRSDSAILEYNDAIDELRASNGIVVIAPDFYAWFQSHQSELDDGVHPNGTGYQSMAVLWFNVLP